MVVVWYRSDTCSVFVYLSPFGGSGSQFRNGLVYNNILTVAQKRTLRFKRSGKLWWKLLCLKSQFALCSVYNYFCLFFIWILIWWMKIVKKSFVIVKLTHQRPHKKKIKNYKCKLYNKLFELLAILCVDWRSLHNVWRYMLWKIYFMH